MESGNVKPGSHGPNGVGAAEAKESSGAAGRGSAAAPMRLSDSVLRVLILAATLIATLIMGMAKQTKTVQVEVVTTLPTLPVTVSAKSTYSSAFIYFLVANTIAFVYTALSLTAAVMMRRAPAKGRKLMLVVAILDLAMVALLFSGNGAAMTFGLLGQYGNSHVGWNKVCNVFGKFCSHVKASIALSMLGTLAYFAVVVLSIVELHRRSS